MIDNTKDTIWSIRGVEKSLRDAVRQEALENRKSMGSVLTEIIQQYYAQRDSCLETLPAVPSQRITDFWQHEIGSPTEASLPFDMSAASENEETSLRSNKPEFSDLEIADINNFPDDETEFSRPGETDSNQTAIKSSLERSPLFDVSAASVNEETSLQIKNPQFGDLEIADINSFPNDKAEFSKPGETDSNQTAIKSNLERSTLFFPQTQSQQFPPPNGIATDRERDLLLPGKPNCPTSGTFKEDGDEDSSAAEQRMPDNTSHGSRKQGQQKIKPRSDKIRKTLLHNWKLTCGVFGITSLLAITLALGNYSASADKRTDSGQNSPTLNQHTASTTAGEQKTQPPSLARSLIPKTPDEKYNIGSRLLGDRANARSLDIGLAYTLSSARDGHVPAQFKVAITALGQTTDYDQQAKLLRLIVSLAHSNYAPAQLFIGIQHLEGALLERNDALGTSWLAKAAMAGNVQANYLLGLQLATGRGVKQNFVAAYQLLLATHKAGHKKSEKMMDILYTVIPPNQLSKLEN